MDSTKKPIETERPAEGADDEPARPVWTTMESGDGLVTLGGPGMSTHNAGSGAGGQVIAGKYVLRDEAGRGGMGTVWRAQDQVLDRLVAIKLMAAKHAMSGRARSRFEREAQALARLRNPHIVHVYDYGIEHDVPYIVMELLEGEDLESRLRRAGTLSLSVLRELLQQICSALTTAASVNIVHRDLKPANVFLVRSETAESIKLLDFGVAAMRRVDLDGEDELRERGNIAGTPAFMSPEQIRGHPPHPHDDLWAVAVIAYRASTGQLPFHGRRLGDLIVSICTDSFSPPSSHVNELPASLDAFFERALAKEPSQRFATPNEFIDAFSEACRSQRAIKILVIDDEPDMEKLLAVRFRKKVRRNEYQMRFALNGQLALDILRDEPDFDVILSDINMPVMDGLTLLREVPQLAPLARVIMVSAYGDMVNIRRAMNAGAFDFVNKPIDFRDLEATIQKTAREVQEHREIAESDRENQVLRKLVKASVVDRLGRVGPSVALETRRDQATVVCLRPAAARADTSAPDELIRGLNAAFEIIVPELEKSGGEVDGFSSDGVIAMYTGSQHRQRALDMCAAVSGMFVNLSTLAGSDSPYAGGVAGGVAVGSVVAGCVGSRAHGRLGHTIFGPAVDQARRLAAAARGEILIDTTLVEELGVPVFSVSEQAGVGPASGAGIGGALDWAKLRLERQLADERSESIAELGPDASESLAFGWTLGEPE